VHSIEVVQRSQPMYNLTVAVAHTFFVGDEQWLVHNCGTSKTEPTLPPNTIVDNEKGVNIEHYYRSDEHGPAHVHVRGGGAQTRIGANSKPLKHDPELTKLNAQ
jgi:hypothetical protein